MFVTRHLRSTSCVSDSYLKTGLLGSIISLKKKIFKEGEFEHMFCNLK